MKIFILLMLTVLSSSALAETWKWNTTIGLLRTYNGSSTICFNANGIDKMLCFDKSTAGGDAKLSMILSAKMSKSNVDVSYSTPEPGETAVWHDHNEFYKSHHLYMR